MQERKRGGGGGHAGLGVVVLCTYRRVQLIAGASATLVYSVR